MLIKVCGMTRADNIRQVEALGIDLMGFIFYPPSPRYVREPPAYLPTRAKRVGVFVDADKAEMLETAGRFGLDYLQLHGTESPELCAELRSAGYRIIKAVRALPQELERPRWEADLLLFDTPTPAHGGSGQPFNWTLLQHYRGEIPFLLSGGIGAEQAAALRAIRHPRFAGIDLNSRFECAAGVKEVPRLCTFLSELRAEPHPSAFSS
ncbi:MAG: phosphoribosylanthranilate isomerase [Prevotellaceae bacterium]|nr:phosphoribosylanthranilate isomerase [Prevotellaceae bacterium]